MPRFIYTIITMCLLSLCMGISACAPQTNTQETITLWLDTNETETRFFRKTLSQFEAAHPQIQIKVRYIHFADLKPTFLGAGKNSPDIILLTHDWLGEFIEKELLIALPAPDENDYLPNILSAVKYKGLHYAQPFVYQLSALFYNTNLVPNPPKTFAKLKKIALQLEATGKYGFIYDYRDFYYHAAIYHAFGGHLFDAKGDIELEQMALEKSLSWLRGIQKEGVIHSKPSYSTMVNLFSAGELGMMVAGTWALAPLKETKIPFQVASIPLVSQDKLPLSFIGVKGFGISKKSKHVLSAKKLLSFFASQEIQKRVFSELDNLPVIKSVYANDIPPIKAAFHKQKGIVMPNYLEMKDVWQEMNWLLGQVDIPHTQIQPLVQKVQKNLRPLP